MRRLIVTWLSAGLLAGASWSSFAFESCDRNSKSGEICLCRLSDLHPTQGSVGMMEVWIRAEKLKKRMQNRSEADFMKYLEDHDRIEPMIVGPAGLFYITDHHHLARALYEIGAKNTYCRVVDNLSHSSPEVFWKHLQDRNEVHLEDAWGNAISPLELPATIEALEDDPFRSLAGAVREVCGFRRQADNLPNTNYQEFIWADYFRANWTKTNLPIASINVNFDDATKAALRLATQQEAAALPGYTGKATCD
jgi:hypothetical protein